MSRNIGNKLTNFSSGVSVPSSGVKKFKKKRPFIDLDLEEGTYLLSRNVDGKPTYFIQNPRRTKTFITFSGVLFRLNMTLTWDIQKL
jgi:hypothetical protein